MTPARRKQFPHIVLIIPRGEAVRNFLYSDTLPLLAQQARVTILSFVDDARFMTSFEQYADIVQLPTFAEKRVVTELRHLIHESHFRWLWSKVAQNVWELRTHKADTLLRKLRWAVTRASTRALAFRPILEQLTRLENELTWRFRPNDYFVDLFQRLQPDLVFNTSHIHGAAGSLPTRVAHRLGIPTVGFIFSWDNLTSRSRIFEPYDHYLVWHEPMQRQLLTIYPHLKPEQVHVTGTPQFDYHFKPEFHLSRAELCARMGLDPSRPFIFYTTGMDKHFPEEHRHVRFIADFLETLDIDPQPQLLVRTYAKGTSDEMKALARSGLPDVVFPDVKWDEQWLIPAYEDLSEYTSCLKHCAMGINPASTVSLELMMFDKPVMNIGFDPPGSNLPRAYRWSRHIDFDHYRPVADSGGVMVAWSQDDMKRMIRRGLEDPQSDSSARLSYLAQVFGNRLDACSGSRIAEILFEFAACHA
ncbi:MAG: hypothetical protein M9918_02990 [Anaerolineae bacterium]|nr:hypothetical protein [Anaerolineae bacterium]